MKRYNEPLEYAIERWMICGMLWFIALAAWPTILHVIAWVA